jgi:hypothetical protein
MTGMTAKWRCDESRSAHLFLVFPRGLRGTTEVGASKPYMAHVPANGGAAKQP